MIHTNAGGGGGKNVTKGNSDIFRKSVSVTFFICTHKKCCTHEGNQVLHLNSGSILGVSTQKN